MDDQTILHPSQDEIDEVTNDFWDFPTQPFQLLDDDINEIVAPPPLY